MSQTAWLLLLLAAACGDDDKATGKPDASNESKDAAMDALVWTPDSGGGDDKQDSGSKLDAAAEDAGVRACAKPRKALPAAALPRCSADTWACVVACESGQLPDGGSVSDCRSACLATDDTAPISGVNCSACVYLQLFACIDMNGCHAPTADTFCCINDKCPPGSADGCSDTMCGNEVQAALECGVAKHPDCVYFTKELIAQCFDQTAEDAGSL